MKARALLLDRDGTLIHDVGYPRDPHAVELIDGASAALRDARSLGYRLVIVSNQSGVARGLITPGEAAAVQARVEELFAHDNVTFDGVYFCFHGPEASCACRKPAPGMLREAAADLTLDLARSIMIGDKASDVSAGRAAGALALTLGAQPHPGSAAAFDAWTGVVAWLRDQPAPTEADVGPRNG